MAETGILFDIIALLLAAVVIVPVLQRLGVPSVLGYLAAGVVLGPYTPGPVVDAEATRPLAEFGVVFLLFAIGLELSLARLRIMRRFIFGLGLAQVAVTSLLLGGAAYALGLSLQAAIIVGMTLAFSSTAAVLAILVERNETVAHYGRIAVSVLIFQDLAVVPVLALLPLLADHSGSILPALGMAGLKAACAMAGIYGVGRFCVRPFYRYISATHNPEVFTAANLLLVLVVAWITFEAGMSMALGAFLAGLLLADSSYRHQVEADIEPFRGLLLGLFFMIVGMSINLPYVGANLGSLILLTLGCMMVKALTIAVLSWGLGLGLVTGVRIGLLLAQVGEFAFVVFARAMDLGLLGLDSGQMLMASVALSMVLTPLLSSIGRRWARHWQRRMGKTLNPNSNDHFQNHVVIAGYGRVGRAIAKILREHAIPYVALDLDAERVATARDKGLPVFYGNASQTGVLRSVGLQQAQAAVVTVNRPRSAERAVSAIRSMMPDLPIIVRAHDVGQEDLFSQAGATALVPETMEASFQMAGLALRSAGVPSADVDLSINRYRRRYRGTLDDAGLRATIPERKVPLVLPTVTLLPATMDHAHALYQWRMDAAARAASVNSDEFSFDQHCQWLRSSLDTPDRRIFIGLDGDVPVGTVRADRQGNGWLLSWAVAPQWRGKGYGQAMVSTLIGQLATPVRALIKEDNPVSIRIARAVGLVAIDEEADLLDFRSPDWQD